MSLAFTAADARRFLTRSRRVSLIARVTLAVDRALVDRALSRDQEALDGLLAIVVPALYLRVGFVLRRRSAAARGRDVRQELDDLVQDLLLKLFADDGRILRSWNPERGLSLERFLGLVSERHVASVMRSQRRNPWMEDPTLAELLSEREDDAPTAEVRFASREMCEVILDRLRIRLSPLALHLFYALVIEGRDVDVVAAETNLPRRAMYNWKNRLLRVVHQVAAELENETAAPEEGGITRAGAKP
jgi:DNA-directed RNA polymerase specialized sigma24 family protein